MKHFYRRDELGRAKRTIRAGSSKKRVSAPVAGQDREKCQLAGKKIRSGRAHRVEPAATVLRLHQHRERRFRPLHRPVQGIALDWLAAGFADELQ